MEIRKTSPGPQSCSQGFLLPELLSDGGTDVSADKHAADKHAPTHLWRLSRSDHLDFLLAALLDRGAALKLSQLEKTTKFRSNLSRDDASKERFCAAGAPRHRS